MISPEQEFKGIYPDGPERPRSVVWTVNGDLSYLNGHFPGTPILPAIAIVDASTFLLQKILNRPDLAIKSVLAAKFMSPIIPGTVVRINLAPVLQEEWQVDWKEESSSRTLATLRLQF